MRLTEEVRKHMMGTFGKGRFVHRLGNEFSYKTMRRKAMLEKERTAKQNNRKCKYSKAWEASHFRRTKRSELQELQKARKMSAVP